MIKKTFLSAVLLSSMLMFSGCLALQFGGGEKHKSDQPTLGQQLMDLKMARDAGAISDAEYERQKAEMLKDR